MMNWRPVEKHSLSPQSKGPLVLKGPLDGSFSVHSAEIDNSCRAIHRFPDDV